MYHKACYSTLGSVVLVLVAFLACQLLLVRAIVPDSMHGRRLGNSLGKSPHPTNAAGTDTYSSMLEETTRKNLQEIANLQKPLSNMEDVLSEQHRMATLNGYPPKHYYDTGRIRGIENLLNIYLTNPLDLPNNAVFKKIFPFTAQLALQLHSYFPLGIPILKADGELEFDKVQVASLMAAAFWGALPMGQLSYKDQRRFNIATSSIMEKTSTFLCLMSYFAQIYKLFKSFWEDELTRLRNGSVDGGTDHNPLREKIGYYRPTLPRNWDNTFWETNNSSLLAITIKPSKTSSIDKESGKLQTVFADKYIGGETMRWSILQEEVYFFTHPEVIPLMLLCKGAIKDEDAIIVVGATRYASYKGYDTTFEFVSPVPLTEEEKSGFYEEVGLDERNRRNISMVDIDAMEYQKYPYVMSVQDPPTEWQSGYKEILRELNKAYVGFLGDPYEGSLKADVVTGNWGCGYFNGNLQLKAIIQWLATSAAGKHMVYLSYEEKDLDDFEKYQNILREKYQTVGQLYNHLITTLKETRIDKTYNKEVFNKLV